jgi:CheY-like chemotaxis protein
MPGKILIVEDQLDHRSILALVLRRMSYQVIEAVDGQQGIDIAMSESPDLIIMDLGLPGIDGIETTIRLKQNPKTSRIPVIAHTIWDEQEHKQKALNAGMVGYLTKPTPPELFKETITKALQAGP